MRIVFLNPVGAIGGAERVLLDALASLRQADPAVTAHVIAGTDGPLLKQVEDLGATATLLPMPAALAGAGDSALIGAAKPSRFRTGARAARAGIGAVQYGLRLRRLITRLQPEVIHSNGVKFHLLSGLALARRWPVVWHLHDFLSERPLASRLARPCSRRVRGAVAISQAVAQDAQKLFDSLPIEVILNGVNTERFSPAPGDGEQLDRLAGMPPAVGLVRVGLVATYARWKGQDVFLDALARLSKDIPVRAYIIGGPIYQTAGSQFTADELRAGIAERGLGERVGLIGFQNDTPAMYRALDVVVHASTRPEPFGLTIVEAMACGKPVIVSAGGGAAELFTHGRDAWGVVPGDADQLAAAVGELCANAALRRELGATARHTALERFGRTRLGPQLLAAYRRFLSV